MFLFKSLLPTDWYGDRGRYVVTCEASDLPSISVDVNIEESSVMINGLQEWMSYVVQVAACNAVGCSDRSSPLAQRTWESGKCIL